jgi:hypothetical protein
MLIFYVQSILELGEDNACKHAAREAMSETSDQDPETP